MFFLNKSTLPKASEVLPGRQDKLWPAKTHFVLKTPLTPPFEKHLSQIMFGMGCFWGAERKFWQIPGVYTTAVGYTAGYTPNPSYEEVCTGMTGHNEAVLVVYDETVVPLSKLLTTFWESHDPTQGMRQGNDRGTQYRSGIYVQSGDDLGQANETLAAYQSRLDAEGFGQITTEIKMSEAFYYAEDYHQQYLAKNPNGYCGIGGCGVQMIKK